MSRGGGWGVGGGGGGGKGGGLRRGLRCTVGSFHFEKRSVQAGSGVLRDWLYRPGASGTLSDVKDMQDCVSH